MPSISISSNVDIMTFKVLSFPDVAGNVTEVVANEKSVSSALIKIKNNHLTTSSLAMIIATTKEYRCHCSTHLVWFVIINRA